MTPETANLISTERISELLSPFLGSAILSEVLLGAVRDYVGLLLKWNAKLNLTAIRDPEEIVTRHFGESLFAATQLFPAGDSRESAIDVGSGAGFPGLPLKLWSPSLESTLVESNQRKATFLREIVRALDLKSVVVLAQRAESISVRADLVTFRAVERFEHILPIACGLVRPGGRLALLIGEGQIEGAQSALRTVAWQKPLPIPLTRNGRLLIGEVARS